MSEPGAGLSSVEAAALLARDGPNVLPMVKGPVAWRQLGGQMVHFFARILWVAGVLAIVAGLPQLGVAIFFVIVVNGVFAFVQERRAEHSAERLQDLLPRRVMVIRDGSPVEIEAADLVVDDLVVLGAGDRVSADLRAIELHEVRVDQSTLTGESEPAIAAIGDTLYAGTFVVEGEGLARVAATGAATRLAGIAALAREVHRPPSPLAFELHRVVRAVATIALTVGVAFFGLALLLGTRPTDGFLFAVGVTVALVPEGLLPTVTLSLAIGAQNMARKNALVRHLESVETLGSTTFICTDKTGTLTQNRMSVVRVWTPTGSATITGDGYEPTAEITCDSEPTRAALGVVAAVGARVSNGRAIERDGSWEAQGDPMEAALDVLARRVGVEPDAAPERRRFPFDPRRRRMSLVAGRRVLMKGAPDAVLPRCAGTTGAHAAVDAMTAQGLRVIAVAIRDLPDDGIPATADDAERDLRLLGLLGFQDPPRPHAAAAVAACRRAGMKIAMITGDHPTTAAAIAREVGLALPDAAVMVGADLPEDEKELAELIDHDGIVLARIDPEDKLRIARALRSRGHVVAMTGDGVNDGPALHEADIGIAMGRSGTDVAREAADLVLLDDDFATVVAAIEQGRATFANVRRFLTYHLTDNVAELTPFVIWALSGARIPLALGVLQILALDIGTDTLPAVALGAEPPAPHILEQQPASGRLLNATVARRAFGILGPTEALMEMAAFFATFWAAGWRPGDRFPEGATMLAASGAAFAAVVVGQTANVFACRSSTRFPAAIGWLTNRLLLTAAAVELVLLAAFLWLPFLADLLDQAPPVAIGWCVALGAAPAVLAADAIEKAFGRIRRRQ